MLKHQLLSHASVVPLSIERQKCTKALTLVSRTTSPTDFEIHGETVFFSNGFVSPKNVSFYVNKYGETIYQFTTGQECHCFLCENEKRARK